MLQPTVSHYFPWDEHDTVARCGTRMTDRDRHSPQPTCPACAASIAAEETALEAALAHTLEPLDTDPDYFALAVDLARRQAVRR